MEGTVRVADGREPFKPQTVLLRQSRAVGQGREPPQAERARFGASIKRRILERRLSETSRVSEAAFRRKSGKG